MSDRNKVKFYKKRNSQHEKARFSHNDFLSIRKWLITGSFHNSFFLNDSFDKSKIHLLKKYINHSPEKIEELFEEAYDIRLNANTFIYTLVLLSNGPFKAKRIFKDNFEKVITSPKELYKFMELCKKERGFGKVIHETIKKWFTHQDIHKLEKMFVKERAGNNWKAQDVMRLIKPKPCDKKEQLLFRWLAKDEITEHERSDYESIFPYIFYYEKMRREGVSKDEMNFITSELSFTNDMIPSNIERTEDMVLDFMCPVNSIDIEETYKQVRKTYNLIPRYASRFSFEEVVDYYRDFRDELRGADIAVLLSVYSRMKDSAKDKYELDFLDFTEELLLEKIKSTRNSSIHIVDTSEDMFKTKLNSVNTRAAIAASVLIGVSKNVFDLNGKDFRKKEPRSILEAEGFNKKGNEPRYEKIFDSIKDIDEDTLFIWTNDKTFPKDSFYQKFKNWKMENKKMIKLVFVNLTDQKISTRLPFVDVYGVNKRTVSLLKLIKDRIV